MKVIFTILLSCLGVAYSYSETSLWKISNGKNTLYLGGTVHILRESDYPLPEAFNDVFEKSNIIVFESSSTSNKLFGDENFQLFIEECNRFYTFYNNNEKTKSFMDLTIKSQVLIQKNEKVFGVFSGLVKLEELTGDEIEIFVQIYNLMQEIGSMSDDEDIKSLLSIAEYMLPKIEGNKECLDIFMNPDFKSLEVILNDDTFGLLNFLCDKYSISLSEVTFYKPYFAYSFLLYQILCQFCKADGVDYFFEKKSSGYGKQIEYLETDEILLSISNSGNEYGDSYYAFLFHSLEDEEQIKIGFEKMINLWKNGINDNVFMSLYEMENFPAVYEALIKNRNNAWMPIIENYLKTSSGVFVLVGNGHMYGPDGLLTQLSEKGYIT
jgi:uncharacterized protein YbaP (TraB family)